MSAVKECSSCIHHKDGICSKLKINVSVNATWCKSYMMNVHIGQLITGDLEENTMLFEIEGEMILKSGKYAIIPIKEYEELTNKI